MSRSTVPPQSHRSHTPWAGFTPRERKRAEALARCPSARCRRVKACVAALDGLYCRRTHHSVKAARHEARQGGQGAGLRLPRLSARPNAAEVEAYRIATELLLARAEEKQAEMLARWKAGELDRLYGPYDRRGALMVPPARIYVEE